MPLKLMASALLPTLLWLSMSGAEARASSTASAVQCVRILYDAPKDRGYELGRTYAVFLQNLLGHFPEFRQIVGPVESYRAGQVNECRATFYLGSYFDNAIPQSFYDDFATTSRNVVWVGYNIWKLGQSRLEAALGVQYQRLTGLDWRHPDAQGAPTFYKDVIYKGETFPKLGGLDPAHPSRFVGPYEMVALRRTSERTQVLAEAVHNGTGERLPYVVRAGGRANRFYVADIPFTYIHEDDRYLVFSDLLFDVLGAPPRFPGKKPAVFRIEDVNHSSNAKRLRTLGSSLQGLGIPFHLAMVPVFADPNHRSGVPTDGKPLPLDRAPELVALLKDLLAMGGKPIWHGVTHQFADWKNPTSGMTGDDFEFWDMVRDRPLPIDSVQFVLNRLDTGWQALEKAGIRPQIWEVPHYQASALDYYVFARAFSWNIGRVMYSLHDAKNIPARTKPEIWYERSGYAGAGVRWRALAKMEATARSKPWGQFFPYEIYGDQYGQRVIPENLGNVQPDGIFGKARTIDDILSSARRNRVLRDAWASFFFHDFLLEQVGSGLPEIERLVRTIQGYGYEFVDLEAFIRDRKTIGSPN